jgi:hypothetical protein
MQFYVQFFACVLSTVLFFEARWLAKKSPATSASSCTLLVELVILHVDPGGLELSVQLSDLLLGRRLKENSDALPKNSATSKLYWKSTNKFMQPLKKSMNASLTCL